ncbi:hypothetical protein Q4497_01285 [Mesomycoplasma ovipneumoniae]|uniref:Uncharacterized protein n=1 Tax=Mesomycoplasma ovipneumoniae TaxID=29562 RepID=A0AAW6Q8P7_9BACT|nr:hypothetical protein [Mesomycoplasma ovipneumoniae]MDF9627990.1 hypothetical protein [Mesomycoplasma ovipneumoniae]MDO4157746.1 hypothetical protein [Mesomycoplasma ovipneumoniae]MDO4158303.1 hypothetical protein [Mesomycoplasma ovipneumoniae]MDO6821658.1 hypothetical protein [Mesomycoplasma ovipneumoniae]MDO6855534.1 hypothetical protein [Mesomycoplasma ovipneumoniae]
MSFNNKKYLFLAPLIVLPWIFPAIIFALQNKNNNLFTIIINDNENLKSNISPNNDLFTINVRDSEALKSNIFSYNDLIRLDKKETIWLKNSHWMPIFLNDNEKIQEIIKKYLYFEGDNFKIYNGKEFDKLSAFFSKEYDKATTEGENFQKLSGNWSFVDYKKIFTKNFFIIDGLNQYKEFFEESATKEPLLEYENYNELFAKNLFFTYIAGKRLANPLLINENYLPTNLSPIKFLAYKNHNFIISIPEKLFNYKDVSKNRRGIPESDDRFEIYFKFYPKENFQKTNELSTIKLNKIQDLYLYNLLDKTSPEFATFLDLMNKKEKILASNNLKITTLYGVKNEQYSKNEPKTEIFSDFDDVKQLIYNKNLSKNLEWEGAFHLANLFIPSKNIDEPEKFNKFILKSQNVDEIFLDEVFYSEIDKNSGKITLYSLNYKSIFPKILKNIEKLNYKNLLMFEKIDFGDINIKNVELKTVNSLEEFNNIYKKTQG